MIDGMRSSLDALKRQSLFAITGNIDMPFPYIKDDILSYVNSSGSFNPLMEKYAFDPAIVSSSQMSAAYLLLYLDFYALYTILYANIDIFNTLKNASVNKYVYIDSMYRDMVSLIKAKELEKQYTSVTHVSMLNPKEIDLKNSGVITRFNRPMPVLNYRDVLTLPVETSRKVKPQSIICYDNDISIHDTSNRAGNDSLAYSIKRKQTNKIGIVNKVGLNSTSVKYSLIPAVTGTVYGYFTDMVYIAYTFRDGKHYISGSSNNGDWSSEKEFVLGQPTDVYIEDDIAIGLSILLVDNENLADGDSWAIGLNYITLDTPTVTAKLKLGMLEQVSYLSMNDTSRFPLQYVQQHIKHHKYDDYVQLNTLYDGFSDVIMPIEAQADEVKLVLKQLDSYADTSSKNLTYNFDFKLSNIQAVINEYKTSGCITIASREAKDLSSVEVSTVSYTNKSGALMKEFIEYNVLVQDGTDSMLLPVLERTASQTVYEFVYPESIGDNNIAKIVTRFPLDDTKSVKLYKLHDGTSITVSAPDITMVNGYAEISIHDYVRQQSYAIEYTIKQKTFTESLSGSSADTAWSKKNNIYYMYYRNAEGNNALAIRSKQGTALKFFNGTVTGQIEMLSLDLPYMSPMIYEYNLLLN